MVELPHMRENHQTAKALLLDHLLVNAGQKGLAEYVEYYRAAGVSWSAISRLIEKTTGQEVHERSLRNWFPEKAGVAA